ncbi:hypothetical protein NUW58_g3075 [Xylaria curta]|uniref:Uncharacterized protein n=1 Tax=Xylaria curta TaxID=42375 RepID=A0ACC1PDZ6_9PEZI|nr:hypothetical protein NUW58_g3075 [Xylaria curta]
MGIIARLASRYNAYFDERPVLTMMVTNAVLGGIADTVAQTITSVKQRAQRKPGITAARDDIEIPDMGTKDSRGDLYADPRSPATPFDFERLTRFMAYGFAMAPIQFKWFGFLSRAFPITKTSAFVPALKRVAVDQIAFAPVSVALFFSVMTVAEGGGRRAVALKLRDMYLPTLKANYAVWPAVQIINFRLMPVQFQLPFVSTIGIAWTAYLSLSNASEDENLQHQNVAPYSPSNIRLDWLDGVRMRQACLRRCAALPVDAGRKGAYTICGLSRRQTTALPQQRGASRMHHFTPPSSRTYACAYALTAPPSAAF